MWAVAPPGASSAASSDSQWEGRAAHFTAKAVSDGVAFRTCLRRASSGYGERHVRDGLVRDRRDPSVAASSAKTVSYKPVVKSGGAQRESDGVVVPGGE